MTIEDYLIEIKKCEDKIYTYQCRIRNLNDKIEQLQQYAKKFTQIGTAIQNASFNSISRFKGMMESFLSVGKKISNYFYESNTMIFSGSEYQKACASTQEAVDSAYRKIDDYNGQIDQMYAQISALNGQIGEFRKAIASMVINVGGEGNG